MSKTVSRKSRSNRNKVHQGYGYAFSESVFLPQGLTQSRENASYKKYRLQKKEGNHFFDLQQNAFLFRTSDSNQNRFHQILLSDQHIYLAPPHLLVAETPYNS